ASSSARCRTWRSASSAASGSRTTISIAASGASGTIRSCGTSCSFHRYDRSLIPFQFPDAPPWWTRFRPTAHYLMETEAHVYALAVAASTLLAFYPFMTVMLSFCRDILKWPAAQQAIYLALGDFFAGEPGEFLVRNLQPYMIPKLHAASMFLLLFTANGIFEPLEVALNRA